MRSKLKQYVHAMVYGLPMRPVNLRAHAPFDSTELPRRNKVRTPEERFWRKVQRQGDCWLWTGGRSFTVEGNSMWVRRWATIHFTGRDPKGRTLQPVCGNSACVRPEHQQVRIPPACKLTSQQVLAIREDPRLYRAIAGEYGVSRSHVCGIKTGKRRVEMTI